MLCQWSEPDLATFTELVERFSATIESRSSAVLRDALQRFHDPAR
jgi:hypothetical protein